MFAQLSLERSDASNGSYLHHQAAKQPLSQPTSQSATTKNQKACYTRSKRQRIIHTVILSTSHQWTALHNTPCQAQTWWVTKNGDNSLLETHAQRERAFWFTCIYLYESTISKSSSGVGMNWRKAHRAYRDRRERCDCDQYCAKKKKGLRDNIMKGSGGVPLWVHCK